MRDVKVLQPLILTYMVNQLKIVLSKCEGSGMMGKLSDHDGKMEIQKPAQIVEIDLPFSQKRTNQPHADMLDYVADMLAELKVLAASTRCETLTGLIDLAAREAQIRHRNPR